MLVTCVMSLNCNQFINHCLEAIIHSNCANSGVQLFVCERACCIDCVYDSLFFISQVYQACACIPKTGNFYPPTLITKVQPVSICVQEEVRTLICTGLDCPSTTALLLNHSNL